MNMNQSRGYFCLKIASGMFAALVLAGAFAPSRAAAQFPPAFVDFGPVLISDQYNNRVIEVDRFTHRVLWRFGDGSDVPGPHSVVGVNDSEIRRLHTDLRHGHSTEQSAAARLFGLCGRLP